MSASHSLGDLQMAIMRVLWQQREATSAEVHAALEESRGLAPTTIATMLQKMEKKGVVRHRLDGRRFVYRPAVTEAAVRRSMVAELVERVFDGSPAALVSHLLASRDVDARELADLRALIGKGMRKEER